MCHARPCCSLAASASCTDGRTKGGCHRPQLVSVVRGPARERSNGTFQLPSTRPADIRLASTMKQMLQVIDLRDDWLNAGLSTEPSDRASAEAAVADLYRLAREPQPSFEWVASPAAAIRIVHGSRPRFPVIRLRAATSEHEFYRDWPVATKLASSLSSLRSRLDSRDARADSTWLRLGVANALMYNLEDALLSGVAPHDVFEAAV